MRSDSFKLRFYGAAFRSEIIASIAFSFYASSLTFQQILQTKLQIEAEKDAC